MEEEIRAWNDLDPKAWAAREVQREEPAKRDIGCISVLFPRDHELSGQGSGAGRELWETQPSRSSDGNGPMFQRAPLFWPEEED